MNGWARNADESSLRCVQDADSMLQARPPCGSRRCYGVYLQAEELLHDFVDPFFLANFHAFLKCEFVDHLHETAV